jgi:hypothetical protein
LRVEVEVTAAPTVGAVPDVAQEVAEVEGAAAVADLRGLGGEAAVIPDSMFLATGA